MLEPLGDNTYRRRQVGYIGFLLDSLLKLRAMAARVPAGLRLLAHDAQESRLGPAARILGIQAGKPAGPARSVAIYAHYSLHGHVSQMVLQQLREYARLGFRVIFVTNGGELDAASRAAVLSIAETVLRRRNFGYDFGSWADALLVLALDLAELDELLLANDSVIGPLHPLDPLFATCRDEGDGLFGLTEGVQWSTHLQSYFLLARGRRAITDMAGYLRRLRLSNSKSLTIRRGELGLSAAMRAAGHHVAALWPYALLEETATGSAEDRAVLAAMLPRRGLRPFRPLTMDHHALRRALLDLPLNPTHHFAGLLVRSLRFPFLKTELLVRNPTRSPDALNWRALVPAAAPCSAAMVAEHLALQIGLPRHARPVTLAPAAAPARLPAPPPPPASMERSAEPAALRVFPEPRTERRLTLLTDSLGKSSLFGGVVTSIVLGALLAERLGAPLRVVTRTEAPLPAAFGQALAAQGISHAGNVEFLFSGGPGLGRAMPLGPDDLMLTTSWWTTWATRRAVPSRRILYLLQEDEREFYPSGDERLRCAEILDDTGLRFIVNTALLRDHLIATGAQGVAANSIAFEPALPERLYHPEPASTPGGKRQFFFYARPNHVRNLYGRGLDAIAAAIAEGVLDPEAWDFTFVGSHIPPVTLPGGVVPRRVEGLAWQDYAALVRRMDLGLSLMYSPHPSYPPLDLAASGAVVVTNSYGRKTSLARYSHNILCVEPSVEALVEGLRDGVGLAMDTTRRQANFAASSFERDWRQAFAAVLHSAG